MADKFGITAELQLVLDSNIETTIEQLRASINKKPTILRLDLQQRDIRDIYKEVGALKKSFANHPLRIGLKHNEADIKLIYREVGQLKKSLYNHPLKLKFDSSGVQSAVKDVLSNVKSIETSLKSKPINAKVGFNSDVLHEEIKKVYSELNSLKSSLKQSITGAVQITGKQEIVDIINLLRGVKTKNISIGLSLKEKTLENFKSLSSSVSSLNQEVSTFNINQYSAISQKTQDMSRALTALNKINGKKITFDLSLKDVKAVDKLDSGLTKVSAGFDKAVISGVNFKNTILGIALAIEALKSGIGKINTSNINTALKTIKGPSGNSGGPGGSAIKTQKELTSSIKDSNSALYDLGVQSAITLKRFGAYTLVTAGFFRLSFALRNATNEFIEYDKELTKIKQVTGGSARQTQELSDQVGELAIKYGVSSSSILNTSQVLAQAGLSTKETQQALEALTKTEVAPTFDDIKNTTEGAIAAMAQFNIKASELDAVFGSINAVSAAFAVESSDITTAIQKAGGAFESAGGSLNELVGAFTAVRSATRESADTVAVGIRTITTRLQRLSTASFLKDFGIDIRRTAQEVADFQKQFGKSPDFKENDFVGVSEALKRISEATSKLGGKDPRLAQIAEELAGFRQINKIIPLLRGFETSQNAIQIAIGGTNSLTKDAVIAQESYANQLEKVRQEFLLLIRDFAQDENIKTLITQLLELAKVAIRVAKTFKDIAFPLTVFAGSKLVSSSKPFLSGFKNKFLEDTIQRNTGGIVPGVGHKDTVHAMLTPNEFVIRESSVKSVGENALSFINNTGKLPKFANGGMVGGSKNIPRFAGGGSVGKIVNPTNIALAGTAALGSFGGVEGLTKLDDSANGLISSFIGFAAQIFFVTNALKGLEKQSLDNTKEEKSKTKVEKSRDSAKIIAPSRTPALQKLFDESKDNKNAIETRDARSVYRNSRSLSNKTGNLALENLKKEVANTDQSAYNRIPRSIRSSLEKAGVSRTYADKASDVFPQMKGRLIAGTNLSADERALGTYSNVSKKIFIKNNQSRFGQEGTLLHEYGHAYDQTNSSGKRLSEDKDFRRRRKQDIKNLRGRTDIPEYYKERLKYFTQNGKNTQVGSKEVFAQAFAANLSSPNNKNAQDFKKLFPLSSSYVSNIVGKPEETTRRAAYLESLQTVPKGANKLGVIEGGIYASKQQDITSRIAKQFNLQDPRLIPSGPDQTVRSGQGAFGYSSPRTTNHAVKSFFGLSNQGSVLPPGKPPEPPRSFKDNFRFFGRNNNSDPPNDPPNNPPNGPGGKFNKIKNGFSSINGRAGGYGGVGIALATGLAGEGLKSYNRPNKDNTGSKAGFVAGGALSSASSGAVIGATIGSFIAPGIGTAIGGAVGGVAGAFKGVVSSVKEFDRQISSIVADKAFSDLGRIFESIKDGKTSSRTSSGNFTSSIKSLQSQLQSTSDPESRKEIFGGLENNKVNIANFVGDIAKISNSYKNFSQRVDVGTQRFIAGILNIPFSEFQENIKKDIESAAKFDDAFQRGIRSIQDFDNSLRSSLRFSEAFTLASQSVNSFAANIEAFSFGSGGSTEIKDTLSTNLGNVQNGFNSSGLEQQINSFSSQFGSIGQELGKTTSDVVRVTSLLPDLLMELRSGSPLDETGDIGKKFSDSLDKLNVGKNVKNLIVSRLEDLLGTGGADSDFFKSLDKDLPGAIATLLEGTKPVMESFAKAVQESNNQLNTLKSSLEKLRNYDKAILGGQTKSLQNNSSLIQARGNFSGRDVSNDLLANERNITNLNTGGRSVGQLSNELSARRGNVAQLETNLKNTEDIQAKAQIITSLERERGAIEKTSSALEYLASSTSELSILQGQLNKAQSERLTKRDFALDFASGSFSDKVKSRRVFSGAETVSKSGKLESVPEDIRKEVISLLKSLGDSEINGVKASDTVNNVANNAIGLQDFFKNSGAPSDKEKDIQTKIEDAFKLQQDAQNAINTNLVNDRKVFFTELNIDLKNFLDNLNNKLQEGQNRDLVNQASSTQSKLVEASQKGNRFVNIQRRFGENAIPNAENIKSTNSTIDNFGSIPSSVSNILKNIPSALSQSVGGGNITTKNLFGYDKISKDKFNETAGSLVKDLPADQINTIRQDLQRGDIGQNFQDNTVDATKAFAVLQQSLEKISTEASGKLLIANESKDTLTRNVGGEKNYNAISQDVQSKDSVLLKSLNDFPKDTSVANLSTEIQSLAGQLQELNKKIVENGGVPIPPQQQPIMRNSGGIVPGFGNTDSVPALLTPGEFVLNKAAVQSVGLQTIRKVNSGSKKFASGGLVQNTTSVIDGESISRFNTAVNQLGIQINNMREAISRIPTEITMHGTHRVDVYVNGAQVFNEIQPSVANLIKSEINNSINKLIKTKMPQMGSFEG